MSSKFSNITLVTIVVLISLLAPEAASDKRKLPDFLVQCRFSSPREEWYKCMNDNVKALKPRLAEGIPDMNIPKLDPFYLERAEVKLPTLRAVITNTTIVGGTNFEILNVTLHRRNEHFRLKLQVLFHNLHIDSNYEISGTLLVFQLNSKGPWWLNASNMEVNIDIYGGFKTKGDKSYVDLSDTSKNSIKFKVHDKPSVYFYNLFNSNDELTKTTNAAINENMFEILEEFLPITEKMVGPFLFNAIQIIFNTYSIDELFQL